MYRTPNGERILLSAERRLFEESLGLMVDHLGVDDYEFGMLSTWPSNRSRSLNSQSTTRWRDLISETARQDDDIKEVPPETSNNKEDRELMIECLEVNVLWDTDFEAQDRLDADPDTSRGLNLLMGISDDYCTDVAHDPPDDQLNLYLDALMGLTPRGRGEARQDDEPRPPNAGPF